MKRPAIAVCYLLGLLLGMIGSITFFVGFSSYSVDHATYMADVNACNNSNSTSYTNSLSGPCNAASTTEKQRDDADQSTISYGLLMAIPGGILYLIAWMSTLIGLARIPNWTLFVLTFFFGVVMILICLITNPAPQPKPAGRAAASPYGAAPASMPYQQPPMSRSYQQPSSPPLQAHQQASPSALEVLRQRYARGEIDTPTFQHMYAQLEAPSPPSAEQ
jgi:hypothetical protein